MIEIDDEFNITCPYCGGEYEDEDDWEVHVSSSGYVVTRADREALESRGFVHSGIASELARYEFKVLEIAEELEELRAKVGRAEEERECLRADFDALAEECVMLDARHVRNAQKRADECDKKIREAGKRLRALQGKEEALEDKLAYQEGVVVWIQAG